MLQINDEDTWPERVRNEFAVRKECFIEQYNGFCEPESMERLDGKRTVIENIADNTGLMLAYRAYRNWNKKFANKRQNLIGLGYTWDQLFWISAAQTWCGVYRKGIKLFNALGICLTRSTSQRRHRLGVGISRGEKKLLTRSEAFEIGVGVGIMMTTISQTYVG